MGRVRSVKKKTSKNENEGGRPVIVEALVNIKVKKNEKKKIATRYR